MSKELKFYSGNKFLSAHGAKITLKEIPEVQEYTSAKESIRLPYISLLKELINETYLNFRKAKVIFIQQQIPYCRFQYEKS